MVEPFCRGEFLLCKLFDHMLGKCQKVSSIRILEGNERHRLFGGKLNRFLIDYLDSLNALGAFFHESIVPYTFKHIIHRCRIIHQRACHAQRRISYILCGNGRSVRPGRRIINVHDKILVIFRRNRIRQHRLEIQLRIQLHKGQEHKPCSIFIRLHSIDQQRIQTSQRIRHTYVHNFA